MITIDTHADSTTRIEVRAPEARSPGMPGVLLIGPVNNRVAVHLWGDSGKRLLMHLQATEAWKWPEVNA